MDFNEWLDYGISKGWCSEAVCVTHEGLPVTDDEEAMWEDGMDPCEVAVRIWQD